MDLSDRGREFLELCERGDFIPFTWVDELEAAAQSGDYELHAIWDTAGAKHFVPGGCLVCGTTGMFRWHFLGRLHHPECGRRWLVTPGVYLKRQLTAIFKWSFAGFTTGSDDKSGGFFMRLIVRLVVVAFFLSLGLFVRLPLAIAIASMQALISWLATRFPDGPVARMGAWGQNAIAVLGAVALLAIGYSVARAATAEGSGSSYGFTPAPRSDPRPVGPSSIDTGSGRALPACSSRMTRESRRSPMR